MKNTIMTKHTTKLAGLAASLLALAATASADVKVNENISVNGYAVGSWTYTDVDGGGHQETWLDSGANSLDAVKLGALFTYQSVSAYGSVLYLPGADDEAGLLEAYATYDSGVGLSVTGGKFLSYLGFEAFDAVNMTQLSYGLTSGIPAYHTGVKVDYSSGPVSFGVAVVDSIMPSGSGFIEGDMDFDDDVGIEAMISYTGIDKLTLFAGIAAEDVDGADDMFTFDFWASYALTDKVTLAGEYAYYKDEAGGKTNSWLLFASYAFDSKWSVIGRLSGADYKGGGDDLKYTIAPTYTINDNLALRAELSFGDGDSGDYTFTGVQAVFKF